MLCALLRDGRYMRVTYVWMVFSACFNSAVVSTPAPGQLRISYREPASQGSFLRAPQLCHKPLICWWPPFLIVSPLFIVDCWAIDDFVPIFFIAGGALYFLCFVFLCFMVSLYRSSSFSRYHLRKSWWGGNTMSWSSLQHRFLGSDSPFLFSHCVQWRRQVSCCFGFIFEFYCLSLCSTGTYWFLFRIFDVCSLWRVFCVDPLKLEVWLKLANLQIDGAFVLIDSVVCVWGLYLLWIRGGEHLVYVLYVFLVSDFRFIYVFAQSAGFDLQQSKTVHVCWQTCSCVFRGDSRGQHSLYLLCYCLNLQLTFGRGTCQRPF